MIKRIASALVLVPIAVWLVLFADSIYFAAAMLFVGIAAYTEWLNMDSKGIDGIKIVYLALGAFFLFTVIFFKQFALYALLFVFLIHGTVGFSSVAKEKLFEKNHMFIGIVYVSLYAFLYFIMLERNGRYILMALFISIWAADTFAYFCGRQFGKHKLAKTISPKKTVEGGVCGVAAGFVIGGLSAYFFHLPVLKTAIVLLFANVIGILGDLFESVIKRAFNKKDSSNIIPGHGGILDRLDSIAFAGFFVYMVTLWKIL